MKSRFTLRFVVCVLLSLLPSESVSASVYFKKPSVTAVTNQGVSKESILLRKRLEAKAQKILPFSSLAVWTLQPKLLRWLDRSERGRTRQVVENSTTGCFKIKQRNTNVILASTFKMGRDSIKYTLCNTSDSTVYALSIKEVVRIEGNDGYTFYDGNRSFETYSVVSIFSTIFGYLLFLVLPGLAAVLLLLAIISGIVSLVRLRKHRERYDNVGLSYFFAIVSLLLTLGIPIVVVMAFIYT